MLSSVDGHDHVARRLAVVTDALIVSVDYRLAPEHPFPQPHDDCWAVTQWLSTQAASIGGDPSRLVIFGDSAGAILLPVSHFALAEGLRLCAQVLCYPCVDTEQDAYPSMTENATGYFLTAADMSWFWGHYLANGGREPVCGACTSRIAQRCRSQPHHHCRVRPTRDEGALMQNVSPLQAPMPNTLRCLALSTGLSLDGTRCRRPSASTMSLANTALVCSNDNSASSPTHSDRCRCRRHRVNGWSRSIRGVGPRSECCRYMAPAEPRHRWWCSPAMPPHRHNSPPDIQRVAEPTSTHESACHHFGAMLLDGALSSVRPRVAQRWA